MSFTLSQGDPAIRPGRWWSIYCCGGSSGSSAAIEMVDVSQLHVDVLVDETEIANVQVGQTVQLTLDALAGLNTLMLFGFS